MALPMRRLGLSALKSASMPVSAPAGSRILARTLPTTQPAPLRTLARQFHPAPVARAKGFKYKTVEEAKARYRSGPFSWKAGLLFISAGCASFAYFRYEKGRLERERIRDQHKAVGKPKVGGAFALTDQNGKEFTSEDLKGRFSLVYFGFTHCPDICPEELDKMAEMIDLVEKDCGDVMTPVFITCDPARDYPEVMKSYLQEFHPKMVGLTGTYDQIKAMCKLYRVYFSTPPTVKPGQDYLVDHSIYFYFMDPEGNFVEAIGRQHTPQQAARIITSHIKDWKGELIKH